MCVALLTEPVSPGSHAGLLFMHDGGFAPVSGAGIIAATTIALERRLLETAGDTITYDTEAGTVTVRARVETRGDRRRVDAVVASSVPAFVHTAGATLQVGSRGFRADLAFGGLFYAILDTEAVGVPMETSTHSALRTLGVQILEASTRGTPPLHPTLPDIAGVAGVIFTAPPRDPEAHLRTATITGRGSLDRSPCATATAAVMAVLDAMGLLPDGGTFVQEGLTGALHRGRVVRRTEVGELPAVLAEVEGAAWITGEHAFEMDDEDPLREGFRLGT
jgi:proline racemase